MTAAELSTWLWAATGAMATLALGLLAYALWVLAAFVQKLEGQLLPKAESVVQEAQLILEEARNHVGLVAEATGRAEALMAAAEPSVERLAAAAEAGSQAAGAVAGGIGMAKSWVHVAAVASAAAWQRYREGKGPSDAASLVPAAPHFAESKAAAPKNKGPQSPPAPPNKGPQSSPSVLDES